MRHPQKPPGPCPETASWRALAAWLAAPGHSQTLLRELSGVSQPTISNLALRRTRPDADSAALLASVIPACTVAGWAPPDEIRRRAAKIRAAAARTRAA